jgi:hypothetical protein
MAYRQISILKRREGIPNPIEKAIAVELYMGAECKCEILTKVVLVLPHLKLTSF